MSRKAFLLLIVRIDSTSFIGGDCLKSQIFLSENRKSASGLRGTEYFSLARTFRTVWRIGRELIGYNEEDCLTKNP